MQDPLSPLLTLMFSSFKPGILKKPKLAASVTSSWQEAIQFSERLRMISRPHDSSPIGKVPVQKHTSTSFPKTMMTISSCLLSPLMATHLNSKYFHILVF